ncbi:MAG: hypothetical protein E6Q97_14395 [Desulfurellales bacterium]|nr:MAG: hypothetical protein E6Q97_14395 [Desulfurellales bacterium]
MSDTTPMPLTPTPGRAWRQARERGEIVTLPSGNVARLRPVAVDALLAAGRIPDLLSGIAAKTIWVETDTATIAEQAETAKSFADLINLIVPLAMLEPRIVAEPEGDGEISLDDVEFADKVAIFQLSTGGSTVLKSFRAQQARAMAPVPDGKDVQSAPEQPGGGR